MNLNKLKKYYSNSHNISSFYLLENEICVIYNISAYNIRKSELKLPNIIISLLFSEDIIKIQLALNLIE